MAESNQRLWIQKCDTIPASSTKTVDMLLLTTFGFLEYGISFINPVNNRRKMLKMAVNNDDGEILEQRYGLEGRNFDVEVNTTSTATHYELKITNNESFALDIKFARLKL